MQKYSDKKIVAKLRKLLPLAITKPGSNRSVSLAYSKTGKEYLGASVASDTHFFHINSEQIALTNAALNNDYKVYKIVTLRESAEDKTFSPMSGKVMIDYSIRTGVPIKHTILGPEGEVFFDSKDISKNFPFYNPSKLKIERFKKAVPKVNYQKTAIRSPLKLREFAIRGLGRNFPLSDTASGYGTALTTRSGKVYFGGQYSSPDKRLGFHSEVATILSALMSGEKDITSIGIVSSKYPDTPCDMCGICRQFIAEISAKLQISPTLYCFAKDNNKYRSYKIEEYLPSAWTSKKWN